MYSIAATSTVKDFVERLKKAGCIVEEDMTAGTIRVREGDITVYSALRKGASNVWLVNCKNGKTITWKN